MTKAIVLYNSKGGNTKKVATKIAEGLGVECFDNKHIPDLKDYDLVVVGTWVMMGMISFPGKRYLKKLTRKHLSGKKVALFITCGGPEEIHPSTEKTTNPKTIKEVIFESMEKILRKNEPITILPERFYSIGTMRMFGKEVELLGHPTEDELLAAKAFGEKLKEQL